MTIPALAPKIAAFTHEGEACVSVHSLERSASELEDAAEVLQPADKGQRLTSSDKTGKKL